jgi:hypothetical protein
MMMGGRGDDGNDGGDSNGGDDSKGKSRLVDIQIVK